MSELKNSFDRVLHTEGLCPENSLYYVAIGAALCAKEKINIPQTLQYLENYTNQSTYAYNSPLFENEAEYEEFIKRHDRARVETYPLEGYHGKLYLGIDSGSTTLKFVLIDEDSNIRYENYQPNKGNPVSVIKKIF